MIGIFIDLSQFDITGNLYLCTFISIVKTMRSRGSSKTAELAAMTRNQATHSNFASEVMNDPFAKYFLGPSTQIPYLFNRLLMLVNPYFWRVGINSVGFLIALCRHRFMGDLIMKSVDQGIKQVVLIGAGYDTNFLRNPGQFKDARLFEIDHPNTQTRKIRIIRDYSLESTITVNYIGLDLEHESIENQLYNKGLDSNKAVLVIAEGVLSYLSIHSFNRLFQSLSGLSEEVRFAGDYRFPQMNDRNVNLAVRRWRNEFKMMNEKYRSFFNKQELEQKLSMYGFHTTRHFDLVDLWQEYSGEKSPEHLNNLAGLFVSENGEVVSGSHSMQ